jgi:hypothetical protein
MHAVAQPLADDAQPLNPGMGGFRYRPLHVEIKHRFRAAGALLGQPPPAGVAHLGRGKALRQRDGLKLFRRSSKLAEINFVRRHTRVNFAGFQYPSVTSGRLIRALCLGKDLSPQVFLAAQTEFLSRL